VGKERDMSKDRPGLRIARGRFGLSGGGESIRMKLKNKKREEKKKGVAIRTQPGPMNKEKAARGEKKEGKQEFNDKKKMEIAVKNQGMGGGGVTRSEVRKEDIPF